MKKVAITGASGLVGQNLIKFLPKDEFEVIKIGRSNDADVKWQPDEKVDLENSKLEGVDIFIHLAGENIAAKRWSKKQKEYILKNRENTAKLASSICEKYNIKNILVASAIGYYGHRPNEICTEKSNIGQGFTCDVCGAIESAFLPLTKTKARVAFMRFGVVLSKKGGALPKMALPFKLFGGGPVGNGKQIVSWVDIDDVALAILHIIKNNKIEGAVNLTAPEPVSNRELGKAIAGELKRPFWFPFPSFAVKLMFGEMGDTLLLKSSDVRPQKLLDSGFHFSYPSVKASLKNQYK